MALDKRLVEDAREMRSPTLDRAMSVATALGEPWALGAAGVLVGLDWLAQDRKADLITWASALVGGGLLNELLKRRFHRARPALKLRRAHATGYSFPSGHAMMTLSTYGTLAYLVSRRGNTAARHPVASLVHARCWPALWWGQAVCIWRCIIRQMFWQVGSQPLCGRPPVALPVTSWSPRKADIPIISPAWGI